MVKRTVEGLLTIMMRKEHQHAHNPALGRNYIIARLVWSFVVSVYILLTSSGHVSVKNNALSKHV